jgi:hypothetical protein
LPRPDGGAMLANGLIFLGDLLLLGALAMATPRWMG